MPKPLGARALLEQEGESLTMNAYRVLGAALDDLDALRRLYRSALNEIEELREELRDPVDLDDALKQLHDFAMRAPQEVRDQIEIIIRDKRAPAPEGK